MSNIKAGILPAEAVRSPFEREKPGSFWRTGPVPTKQCRSEKKHPLSRTLLCGAVNKSADMLTNENSNPKKGYSSED